MFSRRFQLATAAVIATTSTSIANIAHAQDHSVWLHENEETTFTANFLAGENIRGVCDGDCFDLNLFLYDSAGNLVAQDSRLGSAPAVTVPHSGVFTVRASMPNCTHAAGCAAYFQSDYGFTVDVIDATVASTVSPAGISPEIPHPTDTSDSRALWSYNRQVTTIMGYFAAGENIRGVCDQACSDLNLFLYDNTGNLVSQDVAQDLSPAVTVPTTGQYRLEVFMPDCSYTNSCTVEIIAD
ncbi:MAG: hypothetical protein AAFU71_13440 [Cyanobacteria bacterium J06632_22]